ncbi:hypothetical protein COL922a_010404 [Colletotrichum nupharicola]|nr:hypothetical protein COL922a_010404 [Colletotrichum nupharicola]
MSVEEVDLLSAVTSQETSKLPTFDDDFDGVIEYWGSLENPQKLMVSTVDEGSPYDYQKAWSLSLAAENELSGSPDTIVDDDPLFKAPPDVSKLDPEAILADFDWEIFGAQEEKLQPQRLEYEGSVQPGMCNF